MIEHTTDGCQCEGKKCTKCEEVQCVGEYTKQKNAKNGLRASCRTCARKQNAQWRQENLEYNRARVRAYNASHREERHAYDALWRQENKEYDQERHKRYREENIEKVKLREKEYRRNNRPLIKLREDIYWSKHKERQRAKARRSYWKHREKRLAREKIYRQTHLEEMRKRERSRRSKDMSKYKPSNKPYMPKGSITPMSPEEIRTKWKEYYYKNWEYHRKRAAQWIKDNPRRHAARQAKRRTLKTQAGGNYTTEEWNNLCNQYNHTCLCCGKKEPEIKLTADHIIPVVKSGHSNIDNIQPLCGSCNSSKGKKVIDYRTSTSTTIVTVL